MAKRLGVTRFEVLRHAASLGIGLAKVKAPNAPRAPRPPSQLASAIGEAAGSLTAQELADLHGTTRQTVERTARAQGLQLRKLRKRGAVSRPALAGTAGETNHA